jgi:hypothetical protein
MNEGSPLQTLNLRPLCSTRKIVPVVMRVFILGEAGEVLIIVHSMDVSFDFIILRSPRHFTPFAINIHLPSRTFLLAFWVIWSCFLSLLANLFCKLGFVVEVAIDFNHRTFAARLGRLCVVITSQ